MNQLQNLLHDALIATNHVQSCAILKRKDAVLRASSVGFSVSTVYIYIYIIIVIIIDLPYLQQVQAVSWVICDSSDVLLPNQAVRLSTLLVSSLGSLPLHEAKSVQLKVIFMHLPLK